jgi:hypothetical protein
MTRSCDDAAASLPALLREQQQQQRRDGNVMVPIAELEMMRAALEAAAKALALSEQAKRPDIKRLARSARVDVVSAWVIAKALCKVGAR